MVARSFSIIAAGLVTIAGALIPFAGAWADGMVTRLDRGAIVDRHDPATAADMSAVEPRRTTEPRKVALPHRLRRADGNAPGVFWFEIELPPLAAMPADPAIFLPRLTDGATFYLNGAPVFNVPGADALKRVRWRRARAFVLPVQWLLADGNVLSAKIINRDFTVDFPYVLIGPAEGLQAEAESRQWVDQYGSQFTGVTAIIIGIFILSIWWYRRKDRYYLWFGLSSLLWALRMINYSVELMPANSWWWWRAGHFLTVAAATGTLVAFFFSFAGIEWRRKGWAFAVYALLGPLLVIASDGRLHEAVYTYWQGPLFILITAALARFAWWGYRQHSYEVLIITVGVLVAIALAANDYATISGLLEQTRVYTLHLALPVLLMTIGILLTIRFVRALRETEEANRVLIDRLAEREAQLAAQFDRTREVERREARGAERQRIMQDMHDGLGAQLISSLVMVEKGDATPADVAVLLRECLDELRLAIDTFGEDDVDLIAALASLRHRMEPRLRAAGMQIEWTMDEGFAELQPDDQTAMQLLRIVQEALANVIRHSRASKLAVRFQSDRQSLSIVVSDNGQGNVEARPIGQAAESSDQGDRRDHGDHGSQRDLGDHGDQGDHGDRAPHAGVGAPHASVASKGLSGIRKRAHSLRGSADIESNSGGTTVIVRCPVQSRSK